VDLNDYQEQANRTDQRPLRDSDDEMTKEMALVFPLMGLGSEVGSLLTQYKKHVRDRDAHPLFSKRVAEELGDVLWYVGNLAGKLGLDLDDVAEQNLKRIAQRWPIEGEELPAELLDDDYPPGEQLPRQTSVVFEEVKDRGRNKLQMTWNGEPLGDPLIDMSYDEDGYRYHDAFHLTYAALLGWSPLCRALFGTKRESNQEVREIEDGARAIFIEEGLSAVIFGDAREHNFYEGVEQLESELLRSVINNVSHLEVRTRTISQWQQAILRSFEIWRLLLAHKGGIVHLDLPGRTIEFEAPA
jgi:NTP pyrophosphatase (non-canonical NTP hydrolase)